MRLWTQAIRKLGRKQGALADGGDDHELARRLRHVAASNDSDGVAPHAAITAATQKVLCERISAYIDANLAVDTLDAAGLMRRFGVSRSMLCRAFESAGGVANYVRTRRLERAVLRLSEDAHCNITDMLYEIGFTSPRQFQRAFRSHFGMSPMQWREHCHGVDVDAEGDMLRVAAAD